MAPADDQPPGEGGFLSRWSRLKRQPEPVGPAPEPVELAPAPPVEAAVTDAAPPADPRAEAEERERQEILAKLPSIESITASTDVSGFMHRLVPHALRNAALRAAWSADPAIRDFLNDAREYALDYNTPGAAPGYGPLTESDDVQGMISQIFGRPVDKTLAFLPEEPAGDAPDSCDRESHPEETAAEGATEAAVAPPPELVAVRRSPTRPPIAEGLEESIISTDANDKMRSEVAPQGPSGMVIIAEPASRLRRRGGKATPV